MLELETSERVEALTKVKELCKEFGSIVGMLKDSLGKGLVKVA